MNIPHRIDRTPLVEARRRLARVLATQRMERLCGERRVALALLPLPPLSRADIDAMAADEALDEALTEGRHHRPFPTNPHDS